ncbi:MAG TPA: hypothetical protein ENK57_07065 [Polyangiaceae bacterium]|nr:hypothetical protein [Polyangiaceae bacterium]
MDHDGPAGRRVIPLVLTALLGLGCGGEADRDAGMAGVDAAAAVDAGGLDSGALDAGGLDSGGLDSGGLDSGVLDSGVLDASADSGADASSSCLDEGHSVGERYSLGDDCNFCDCLADGSSLCTARTCAASRATCDYAGVTHDYAERFPATDGCNECVCAASGLACTRRTACGSAEEGAILLESLTEACGDDPLFTGAAVLAGLPNDDVTTPFPYERDRPAALYPETLPDTLIRVRVAYDGGFVVCRIPMPTQPAIDMEVVVEWMTQDGAFDEGVHTYLRRNGFGFLDAWTSAASVPLGGLNGSYVNPCLDGRDFSFAVQFNADGSVRGAISKVCETDLFLDVGRFMFTP